MNKEEKKENILKKKRKSYNYNNTKNMLLNDTVI